jgi:hypothetical protein
MAKRKNSEKRFVRTYFFLTFITIGIILAGKYLLFPNTLTALHPLARLSEPKEIAIVYLPEPYIAAIIESPVLGAETIDPSDIILYINNERMKVGSPPLRENTMLSRAAGMRAKIIMKYQNFSHQDPYEHIQLDTVLPMVNYPFKYASENIGMGDNSARAFVNGFMSSPLHKANLLNPKLEETGVAIETGAYTNHWVNIAVQLFAIPATQEQYLGYQKEDIAQYKRLIYDLESQIALTRDYLKKNADNREYYEGWQKILIRQHQILVTLYNTMQQNQPFVHDLISLIREYNTNWSHVPKT